MNQQEQHEVLREHYLRLRAIAFALLADCKPAGGDEPMCAIPPHRIRDLRRELEHEPRPQSMAWMSVT